MNKDKIIANLKLLRDALMKIAADKIKLEYFKTGHEVYCAVGWAAHMSEFNLQGLRWETCDIGSHTKYITVVGDYSKLFGRHSFGLLFSRRGASSFDDEDISKLSDKEVALNRLNKQIQDLENEQL